MYLYELLDYAEQITKELDMKFVEFYDRANHMRIHKEENLKKRCQTENT